METFKSFEQALNAAKNWFTLWYGEKYSVDLGYDKLYNTYAFYTNVDKDIDDTFKCTILN